eukprot:scaffold748_cov251-Pinguiococcus_pyrenoidosus.AAC.16
MGSRREALALYRDCLRAARRFHWANDKGEPWYGGMGSVFGSDASPPFPCLRFSFLLVPISCAWCSPHHVASSRSDVLKKSARKEFEEARTERVRTDQPLQQEMSWA